MGYDPPPGPSPQRFHAALAAAGLGHLRTKEDPFVLHDLRHTFGTLAMQVAPISDVQAWMGHAQVQTTMIHIHYVPQHDAADRLTRALRGSGALGQDLSLPSQDSTSLGALTRTPSSEGPRAGRRLGPL